MALKFTTTGEAASDAGIKVAVYGRSGVGKTRLCATAPRPIILSAEKGLLSLSDTPDIPVLLIETVDDLTEAYEEISSYPDWMDDIDTICIDSATEIAEKILANAKELVKDPRQAYGELADRMIEVLKGFRDIEGKHVVIVFKQGQLQDEIQKRLMFSPMMPGTKLSPQIPYLFDEVFCLREAKDTKGVPYTFLQTNLDLQYDAKDRSGRLEEIEYPDLAEVFNKILGE